MPATPIIETRGLTKKYGSHVVVNDLSFAVQPGEVYGFLGENGAGKSTSMRLMLGLIHADSGGVFIKNKTFKPGNTGLLRHIGAIIERPDLYNYLTAAENIRLLASLSGTRISRDEINTLLELTGLQGRGADKVKTYSQGMKQRLAIATAIAHNPDLLILDEPTNGLDPQGIADMRVLIKKLSREMGKTIIISSHLLYEIEQVATRVLIIHKGRRVAEGPLQELADPAKTSIEITTAGPATAAAQLLGGTRWNVFTAQAEGQTLSLRMHPDEVPALNEFLVGQGIGVRELRAMPSLESLFLKLTATP